MSKFLKSARSGYVLVFLAFLLPVIVASIYFAINFTERTSIYSHKDCSADAALTAIKNYNFGAPFEAQKLGLLSKADNVYNDKAVMHSDSTIKHEELIVTPNCFSIVPTDSNITEFNQFVGLYSSIDMSYRQGFFYDENYIKNAKYLASECKVLDVSIHNTGINLACNCVLPAEKGFNGYCNAYPNNEEHNNNMKFTFNKNSNTTSKTINLSKRVADTDKLTIQKDGDSLVVNIKDDLSGKTYSAKAIPAKCNVDIVMCIPTNGAACNENNLDLASVKTGDSTGLPLKVETTETSPSVNVQNTSIYQISQACKKFIKDNFMATQGVCAGIVPYSGKLSIPHYRFDSWGAWQVHFDGTHYTVYANHNVNLHHKVMGYYLYGSCGDSTKSLSYGNVPDSTYGGLAKGVLNTWHKYGANIRHQRGLLSSNPRNDQNYDYDVDVSAIPTNRPEFDTGYLLSSLYPAYLGYANVLRGKADEGSIDYLPNPYYVIELTPDMVKICDLLECFRPINDEYSCSNFLFLPFYWSNALLNYPWSDDPVRESDANYFSQESKLTEGRSKAVILFVNKPDHFEPGEMTYLGFSNDNQEFDLAESDTILFNIDYSSNKYRFYDGTTLGSLCKTTSPNVELYGQKKILKFKQLSGSMVKIPEGTSSADAEYKSDYFWKVPEDSVTKAKLSCPQKHLIKLVFEGNYLDEAIKQKTEGPGTVTFYQDIVKEYPSDNTNKHITDCRIDSTDGESVPLDTPYEISKPTTFVFSGPIKFPMSGDNHLANWDSTGPNFRGNLSPYKVKYLLNKAAISAVTLKKQLIRDYMGKYGAENSTDGIASKWQVNSINSPVLIMRNSKLANRMPTDVLDLSGSSTNDVPAYSPYGNTDDNGNTWTFSTYTHYVSQTQNSNLIGVTDLFRDLCIERQKDDVIKWYSYIEYGDLDTYSKQYYSNIVYGVHFPFSYYIFSADSIIKIFLTNDAFKEYTCKPSDSSYAWNAIDFTDAISESEEYIKFTVDGKANIWRIQNTIDKTLLTTDFVDKDTLDEAMRKNTGVCLYNLTESEVNERGIAISQGNYICFQGDGELHVTIEPDTEPTAQGLYLSNIKDSNHVTVVDHGSSLRPNRKVVYIDPQAISDDVDEDGNYHVDLMMNNVKLISAELTNRPYTKEDPKITITETSTKADDVVTEGENYKKTEPGDTTTTYQIIANDSRPIMVAVDKSMVKTRVEEPYGTVNFSSKNGVSDCKTASGEIVPLDTDYKFCGETEFVFSGGNLIDPDTDTDQTEFLYYAGATGYSRWMRATTNSPNFDANLSPYKVKYLLTNSKIIDASLKNQILRDYFCTYGTANKNVKFLRSNGSIGPITTVYKCNCSGSHTCNQNSANDRYVCSMQTCGLNATTSAADYINPEKSKEAGSPSQNMQLFRDSCLVLDAVVAWRRGNYLTMYLTVAKNGTANASHENFFIYAYGIQPPLAVQVIGSAQGGTSSNGVSVGGTAAVIFQTGQNTYTSFTKDYTLNGAYGINANSNVLGTPEIYNGSVYETDKVKMRYIWFSLDANDDPGGGFCSDYGHYRGFLIRQDDKSKPLLNTDFVDTDKLDEAMAKNTGICLYNLEDQATVASASSNDGIAVASDGGSAAGGSVSEGGVGEAVAQPESAVPNDVITAGNYICFQGDGELHVKMKPTENTIKTDIYKGSYSYNTKSAYQHGDMNTPYKWYNTNTGTLKSAGGSWNYEVVQGAYYRPPYPEAFVLSPDTATYTRGKNGEYIYTITCVNAKISADFVDNTAKVYHFEKDQAPEGQRSLDFYKATEDHAKDLTIIPNKNEDLAWINGGESLDIEAVDGSLLYKSNLDFMYQQERMYPDITYKNNTKYWNYSSSISTFPYNYCGDWTTKVGKIDSDYFCTVYKVLTYNTHQEDTLVPCDVRFFKRVDRHTGAIHEFICDNWISSKDTYNIYENPYGGFSTIKMSSYTYPKNYALDQFVTKHPEYSPTNQYDQDEILKTLTGKCATDLKAKNSKTKIYVVKYRKQEKTKPFPTYTQANADGRLNKRYIESEPVSCNYSYLDSCASGSDYIYDCSSPEELETVMSKIAERVKQEAGYTTAHCESVN